MADQPLAVLLLPRPLPQFLQREQVADLLRSPGVLAVDPPPLGYGATLRAPVGVTRALSVHQARRMAFPGTPRVVVIYHPVQMPLAGALLDRHPEAELWYSRWDLYEEAPDASARVRDRLRALHAEAVERAALVFAVSDALADIDRAAAREVLVVPTGADDFPAPDPAATVVAVSLGHLGHRNDWTLLRQVAERMPELVLLLVGAWHEDECRDDPDFAWCRGAPGFVWLGPRSDDEASALIRCADAGIVPFTRAPFNETGLPNRILKYARLGRATIAPPLPGIATWGEVVTTCETAEEWVAALRAAGGVRARPDAAVRDWALTQTVEHQNAPLRQRLAAAGIAEPPRAAAALPPDARAR